MLNIAGSLRPLLAVAMVVTVAIATGAVWHHRALEQAWSRGYQAGQIHMAERQRHAIEQSRALARSAAEVSDRKIVELEQHRDELQKKLASLATAINRSIRSDSACLGPDILRALSATGNGGSDNSAGAR